MKTWFLILFLLGWILPSYAGDLIEVNTKGRIVVANTGLIIDSLDNIPPSEILNGSKDHLFKTINLQREALGLIDHNIWLKTSIKNNLESTQEFILAFSSPLFVEITFYSPELTGPVSQSSGINYNYRIQPISKSKPVFKFIIPPGETKTFYVAFNNHGGPTENRMELWTYEEFTMHETESGLLHGIFFGMIIMTFIINLFIFIALKERIYGYYISYLFTLVVVQAFLYGYLFLYLPDNPWMNLRLISFVSAFTILSLSLFTREFLDTKRILPIQDKVLKFLPVPGLLLIPVLVAGYYWAEITIIITMLIMLTTFVILFIAIKALSKGCRTASFFITAFIILIIGITCYLFRLFNLIDESWFTQHGMKVGTLAEIILLSFGLGIRFKSLRAEKEMAQQAQLDQLKELNRLKDEANIILEQQVKERTLELNEKNLILEELYKDVRDSINYAQRIQLSILPEDKQLQDAFPYHFVFYRPKDIVSGDFYFHKSMIIDGINYELIAAADCTGHGVPGALMSMIGSTSISEALKEVAEPNPGAILSMVHKSIKTTLKQHEGSVFDSKDGMDIALCIINTVNQEVLYAGAQRPMYLLRKDQPEVIEVKADKSSLGGASSPENLLFRTHTFQLSSGDSIYLFSDGYADQFGGDEGKKFMTKRLRNLLSSIWTEPMEVQGIKVQQAFDDWKKDLTQVDDVLVIGIKL